MTGKEVSEALKEGVRKSLPEVAEIQDAALREKVVEAWALALSETEYESLDGIPCSGVPEAPEAPGRTQAHHLRATAKMAVAMGEALEELFGPLGVSRDELMAGGLCHDLGKPFEYDRSRRARWDADPRVSGRPAVRHPVYGVHIAIAAGLPENIVHIAGGHSSMEGQFITRSLGCMIVAQADHACWEILRSAGILPKKG